MAIENPIISAPSIERGRARTVAVPTVYELPVTNPSYVSSSSSLVYTEKTVTNYSISSENFDSSIWSSPVSSNSGSFITTTVDSVSSPIGTMTADRCTCHPALPGGYLRQYFKLSEVTDYTYSVYVKVPTGAATTKIAFATTDVFAGIILFGETTVNATTQWQRFSVTATPPDGNGFMIQIGGSGAWAGGQSFDFWGSQLEKSSSMTTYVSTGNDTFNNSPLSASQTFTGYEEVSTAPLREGQMVLYKSGDLGRLYVAVDIDGVITWKPCIGIAQYLNPTTGLPPDSNILLYSPSSR